MSECDNCERQTSVIATLGGQYCAICVDAHHDAGADLDLTEGSP